RDLRFDVGLVGACSNLSQLGDARLKLGDRFFEIEIILHVGGAGRTKLPKASTTPRRQRVTRIDQLDEAGAVNVGVNLRRRDVGMTEERLEHPQVRAP